MQMLLHSLCILSYYYYFILFYFFFCILTYDKRIQNYQLHWFLFSVLFFLLILLLSVCKQHGREPNLASLLFADCLRTSMHTDACRNIQCHTLHAFAPRSTSDNVTLCHVASPTIGLGS